MVIESYLYQREEEFVTCKTCWHRCKLKDQQWGICRMRKNENGKLMVYNYGLASSIALDPIEKKPLHNYKPGSRVLSFGSVGCNFKCDHCQNFEISFADLSYPYLRELKPEDIPRLCKERKADGVAWTYNEPTIWHEFALDASKLAKERGYFIVYVTNGYMTPEAIEQFKWLDAANVDVKAFSQRFYSKICKSKLENVLKTVEFMHRKGIFIEITYLIIPEENDSREEIKDFADWVVSLDKRIPVHFSRFHPDFKMTEKIATPISTLERAVDIAKSAGVEYVYLGNVWGHRFENTFCPNCEEILIERRGFYIGKISLRDNRCPSCGYRQNIVL